MADELELLTNNYLLYSNATYSRNSSRNETDSTVIYSAIEGLNLRVSQTDDNEYNIMVVPELEEALLTNNMTQLKRLMLEGAPYLYEAYNKNRPLEVSAFYSRADIIKIIIERHIAEGKDSNETFVLHAALAMYRACISNSRETAKMLILAGAQVIPQVHLHVAAQYGSWGVLDVILSLEKLNIDERDEHFLTPLHYAAKRGYTPTVGFLLARGADPDAVCDLSGKSALHLACEFAAEDVIYLLVNNRVNVDLVDLQGYTALLIAAESGKDSAIGLLANAGASLDMRNDRGRTGLILAAINGHANVIHELVTNGASVDITDQGRFNALERGIMNRQDSATAMLIRLIPEEDFLLYYKDTIEVSVHKLVKFEMEKSIQALLDRMLIVENPSHCTVMTKYLDLDANHVIPGGLGYKKNSLYLLQRIAELSGDRVSHHGVIRLLVDQKMKKFGYYILLIKLVLYMLFLVALAYSLIHAAHQTNPYMTYLDDFGNYLRIFCEIFVLVYFIVNVITELAELTRVVISTYRRLKDKRVNTKTEKARERATGGIPYQIQSASTRCMSFVVNCFPVRIITDYLKEQSNYLDILSLSFLAILIPLRILGQPVEWVFATWAFIFNSLRIFNYINIIPVIGPYSNIFYKIITKDLPKFAFMFFIVLLIFTGSFFVALRSPYTIESLTNNSFVENTEREAGINDDVIWILLSGLRVLPESNVMGSNYLYKNLNWLAAIIYVTFLVLTVVVFLNVFIAQLSDRYAKVRESAERTFAWHRLNFIVQIQKSSLLSLCVDFRKACFIEKVEIDSVEFENYFGVSDMMAYHTAALEQDVDEKTILRQIKHHVKLATKTRDLTHTMKLIKTT